MINVSGCSGFQAQEILSPVHCVLLGTGSSVPLVYISYSRVGYEISEAVRSFACALLENGIGVVLDQHEEIEVANDHAAWVERRISSANCIVLVLTQCHTLLLDEIPDQQAVYRQGQLFSLCHYETLVIRSCLLGNCAKEIVPVYFGPAPICFRVPLCLRNRTTYFCSSPLTTECEDFCKLLTRLHTFSGP